MLPRGATGASREERAILALLERRASGRTVCPSEVARDLAEGGWRELMPVIREAAYALADAGKVEVTQAGRVVDGRSARGPIRLRLPTAKP